MTRINAMLGFILALFRQVAISRIASFGAFHLLQFFLHKPAPASGATGYTLLLLGSGHSCCCRKIFDDDADSDKYLEYFGLI